MINLKKIRRERGLTQQQLSEISGVPRICIARYESGKTAAPRINTILKLTKALNTTVDSLIGVKKVG